MALGSAYAVCRSIGETAWKDVIEPLIVFDHVLRQDPAGCYARMDFESRDYYRKKLCKIADHSNCSELEVARHALALATEAQRRKYADPRKGLRESHIGYYLVDQGVPCFTRKSATGVRGAQKVPEVSAATPGRILPSGHGNPHVCHRVDRRILAR